MKEQHIFYNSGEKRLHINKGTCQLLYPLRTRYFSGIYLSSLKPIQQCCGAGAESRNQVASRSQSGKYELRLRLQLRLLSIYYRLEENLIEKNHGCWRIFLSIVTILILLLKSEKYFSKSLLNVIGAQVWEFWIARIVMLFIPLCRWLQLAQLAKGKKSRP